MFMMLLMVVFTWRGEGGGGGGRGGRAWDCNVDGEAASLSKGACHLSFESFENDHNCCWEEIPLWARQG